MSDNTAYFVREWCCRTPLTEPHVAGCAFEPRGPIDYMGPVEIRQVAE